MNPRLSLSLALITLFIGCEAQLVCEVCTGDHSTQSHIDRATAEDGGVPDADAMFSDDVLLAFVARHRDDGFIRVNAEPYSSEVSEAKLNVFVSEFALPEYLETAPDEAESDGMIPRGSFVVHEFSIALPAGIWISEWSDASDYHVEFVEIAVR